MSYVLAVVYPIGAQQDPDKGFRIIHLRRLFARFCFADEDALFKQKP